MSGRRSSSAEGTRIGTRGTPSASLPCGIVRLVGGRPVSTAIACSFCARATPTLTCLRLRRQFERLGGDDVGLRGRPRVVLVLRDFERVLVLLDRVVEQIGERVGLAQLHVGERERRLRRQRRVGEVGGARLGRRALLLDRAPRLAPDVERPRAADLGVELVGDCVPVFDRVNDGSKLIVGISPARASAISASASR